MKVKTKRNIGIIFSLSGIAGFAAFYYYFIGSHLGPDILQWFLSLWDWICFHHFKYYLVTLFIGFSIGAILIFIIIKLKKSSVEVNDANSEKNIPVSLNSDSMITLRNIEERIRIAILLPLTHTNDFVREDAELQLQGFGKTLPEIREILKYYDFKYIDHQSNHSIAKDLIIKELKEGTQYFLCTMSSVCIEMSKIFPELDKEYGNSKSVLVCTVAGADEIVTYKNKVYRFYINLKDEIQTLIDNIENTRNNACIIYFNSSPYAFSCAKLFQDKWNNNKENKYHIKSENIIELKINKTNQIGTTIQNKKSIIDKKDVIFIVAYGHSYIDILESIEPINKTALIVTTSTFSFKHWERKIMKILTNFEWLSCKPVLKDGEGFRDEVDVVTYFSMNTLERMVNVIKAVKENGSDFDTEWNKCTAPNKLKYSAISNKEGDYKIELTAKRKS